MTTQSTWPEALRWQARACHALGSAFSGGLLDQAAEGALGSLDDLFAAWEGAPLADHIRDATPLRLLGALHHLVLTEAVPALAALYPPTAPETDWPALIDAARTALIDHRTAVAAFMTSPPQTNEVARSLCLAPGFLRIAQETGLPLRLLEIGASAGLNLNWDRYAYEFGGARWGNPASAVKLSGDWRGPSPTALPPATVLSRAGCDRSPIDIADETEALRLQAYVWPDQPGRLARLRGAIALARSSPPSLEKADAAAWTQTHFHPTDGAVTVLFHSVMWQYMPAGTQKSVSAAIASAARAATVQAPVAWLRMEPDSAREGFPMAVRLTSWPGGEDRHLADVHPHGAWVSWLTN